MHVIRLGNRGYVGGESKPQVVKSMLEARQFKTKNLAERGIERLRNKNPGFDMSDADTIPMAKKAA